MNFITFGTAFTNIFPAANSVSNGQLLTEWNIRSRETVWTDPAVEYQIGPSYTHGEKDFEVSILKDAGGAYVNGYTLEIAPGRALVNGHYVETLVPMTIDLMEANAELESQSLAPLKGDLTIGIRTFYATDQTVAGSILVENENDMFLGVQLVVLPQMEFITPSQSPTDQSKVTADLKLATFTFLNNTITALRNSESKMTFLQSERVADLDQIVSSKYVTKYGLNPKKLYTFGGKGANPATGYDTWEDSTDSIMVWDHEPKRTLVPPVYKQAEFVVTGDHNYLVVPHKQVEGMTDDDGNYEYYETRVMQVPTASYSENTPGIVNKEYTRNIKNLSVEVSKYRTSLNGKQIYFIDTRTVDQTSLPPINSYWNEGDYILVRNDEYFNSGSSDMSSAPATKYVVLPGQVEEIEFITQVPGDAQTPAEVPSNILGCELGSLEWSEDAGQDPPDIYNPEYYPKFYSEDDTILGIPYNASSNMWYDYFRLRYYQTEEFDEGDEDQEEDPEYKHPYIDYFYGVRTSGPRQWSDAVMVTGSVFLADEDVVGGFLNAPEDAIDQGYVRLDDDGRLVLVDYDILRSGTLAYQIATDWISPESEDISTLQAYLDEFINERVAFPNSANNSITPSIIHIYLDIPEPEEDSEGGTLYIHGIDSRFGTAVCFHIQSDGDLSKITISFSDCEKLIIDNEISSSPTINVIRCCLYYDPIVFNYIRSCTRDPEVYGTFTGFRDLSLWYAQRDTDDPNLLVDGMTVSELDAQIVSTTIDYWKELGTAVNDNYYRVALKSITFSSTGDIIGCEVLAANNSTDNIEPGNKIVVGKFVLPQGSSLTYPITCLTRVLKVTGTFTSAYYSDDYWYVTDTSMTLETGVYTSTYTEHTMTGTVAFHSITTLVPSTMKQQSISPWEPDTYHVFRGGAIS